MKTCCTGAAGASLRASKGCIGAGSPVRGGSGAAGGGADGGGAEARQWSEGRQLIAAERQLAALAELWRDFCFWILCDVYKSSLLTGYSVALIWS